MLYAGIPASIVAPMVWILGVLKLGANKASLFLNLTPVFTAIISILFLHETLHTYHLIGGGMSLLGVILAQSVKNRYSIANRLSLIIVVMSLNLRDN